MLNLESQPSHNRNHRVVSIVHVKTIFFFFLLFLSHLLLQNNYIGISKFHKRSNKVKHKEIQSPRRLTLAKMANAPMPNAYRQMITA